MKVSFFPGGLYVFSTRTYSVVVSPLRYSVRIITIGIVFVFFLICIGQFIQRQSIIISIAHERRGCMGGEKYEYEKGDSYDVSLTLDTWGTKALNGTVKTLCPETPQGLGPVPLLHPGNLTGALGPFNNDTEIEFASLLTETAPNIRLGGSWEPSHCTARYRTAVIIPYRDRLPHLYTLQWRLHSLLQAQMVAYRVFVTEQDGSGVFNKGRVMNAAFLYIRNNYPYYDCVIFHDVDMLPEDDRNMYTCTHSPKHLSPGVNTFRYRLPYAALVGGVFAISVIDFIRVNGYSNSYWGWGGEDDDMFYRLQEEKLQLDRSPISIGRYTMILHKKRKSSPRKYVLDLLSSAKKRYKNDGLDQVLSSGCSIVRAERKATYTRILVNVGGDAPWRNDVKNGTGTIHRYSRKTIKPKRHLGGN